MSNIPFNSSLISFISLILSKSISLWLLSIFPFDESVLEVLQSWLSPPVAHLSLQRVSCFEWWLGGWGSHRVFIVMVERDSGMGLYITCTCQLISAVGSRHTMYPSLVMVLLQLTHLVLKCKVLAPDTRIHFVLLSLWQAQQPDPSGTERSQGCLGLFWLSPDYHIC